MLRMFAPGAMPRKPIASFCGSAAMMPATSVPCPSQSLRPFSAADDVVAAALEAIAQVVVG